MLTRGRPRRLAISFLWWRAFFEASRLGSSCRRPTNKTKQLSAALAAYRTSSWTNFDSDKRPISYACSKNKNRSRKRRERPLFFCCFGNGGGKNHANGQEDRWFSKINRLVAWLKPKLKDIRKLDIRGSSKKYVFYLHI